MTTKWLPMTTAPKDGSFIRILTKDGDDIVGLYRHSYKGWKDWQDRSNRIWQDRQCHGWQPVNQDEAMSLPVKRPKLSKAFEHRQDHVRDPVHTLNGRNRKTDK